MHVTFHQQPERDVSPGRPSGSPLALFILVGAFSVFVLLATASAQIFDTNFYTLWEATNLLAGDHPYRDFYEWGVPLQAYLSAFGQIVFGYRLLGEFVVHWVFIVAGVVIATHLALRLCASRWVVVATMIPAVLLLTVTPTYHYPKLFFYPLAVWLTWRYLDRPHPARAAALGVVTAVAFLFRHDHGVYIAAAAGMAFVLGRLLNHESRDIRLLLVESSTYGIAILAVLAPWLITVQRSEGVGDYVRARAPLYRAWSASASFPIRSLVRINPVRELFRRSRPDPKVGVVGFVWSSDVSQEQQQRLQAQYGLRLLDKRDTEGRYLFEVANIFDPKLVGLDPYIRDGAGFQFDVIRDLRSPFPSVANAQLWLMQIALLVPIVLLASTLWSLVRLSQATTQPNTFHIIAASAFLLAAESRLFREESYVVVVAPLVAALAAPLLASAGRGTLRMRTARLVLGVSLFAMTTYAVGGWVHNSNVFHPVRAFESLRPTFQQLVVSPPIDGFAPHEWAVHVRRAQLDAGGVNRGGVLMRYMYECAAAGDRVVVTGITPYHVGYSVNLPIAGGQLFWHHRWRADSVHEQQALALLQRQSVPFAYSASDPVFDDFKAYPAILAYLQANYVEVDGSSGRMLIDRRRTSLRRFGELQLPCFR